MKKLTEYCPFCRKRTPQVRDEDEKLCKRCGKKTKKLNPGSFLIG